MRKISPRLLALMMAGAVTVTSITPVTGYQTITVNAATDSQEKEAAQGYQTNLTGFDYKKGDWKETKDGLYSNAVDKGDCFAFSKTTAKNFVYSTDVTFKRNQGAATLIFRFNNNLDNKECYAVNIDGGSHKCKLWRWQENSDYQLIDEKEVKATDDEKYTLKVVAYDSWISYYVNDTLVASTGDYTLQKDDKGQSTVLTEGSLGLLNWNGEMTFQNTYYTELNDQNTPELKNISVSSSTGDVEKAAQFTSTEPIMIQYVKNNAETVDLNIEKKNKNADVQVEYDGKIYRFDPSTDFGTLDWGRGVWTYDNIWRWGTCSTRLNGVPFGFNLGYGFSDRSSASENVIFYDGRAHKLQEVVFMIGQDDEGNFNA